MVTLPWVRIPPSPPDPHGPLRLGHGGLAVKGSGGHSTAEPPARPVGLNAWKRTSAARERQTPPARQRRKHAWTERSEVNPTPPGFPGISGCGTKSRATAKIHFDFLFPPQASKPEACATEARRSVEKQMHIGCSVQRSSHPTIRAIRVIRGFLFPSHPAPPGFLEIFGCGTKSRATVQIHFDFLFLPQASKPEACATEVRAGSSFCGGRGVDFEFWICGLAGAGGWMGV